MTKAEKINKKSVGSEKTTEKIKEVKSGAIKDIKKKQPGPTKKDDINANRKWHLFDMSKEPLGRVSTQIATKLIGKHKVTYAPHLDCGDFVVVINAEKTFLTGKKADQKKYYYHTNYPGGLKERSFKDILKNTPEKIVMMSVRRMLPVNTLRDKMLKRIKIFKSVEHPYQAKIEASNKK